MKGLFATLLALMMTGMVSGQQPQNSSLPGNQNSVTPDGRSKRFLLVMEDHHVRGLRNEGYLQAPIDYADRNSIDRIVFSGAEDDGGTDLNAVRIQRSSQTQGSRIVFEFSDQLIEKALSNGLIYTYEPQERGRYSEVVVMYKPGVGALPKTVPIGNNPPVMPSPTTPATTPATLPTAPPASPPIAVSNPPVNPPSRSSVLPKVDDGFGGGLGPVATRRNSTVLPGLGGTETARSNPGVPTSDRGLTQPVEQRSSVEIRPPQIENEQPRRADSPMVLPPSGPPANLPSNRGPSVSDGTIAAESLRREQEQRQQLQSENDRLRRQLLEERQAREQLNVSLQSPVHTATDNGFGSGFVSPTGSLPARHFQDRPDRTLTEGSPDAQVTMLPPNRVARLPQQSNKPPAYVQQEKPESPPGTPVSGSTASNENRELLADSRRIQRQNSALWFIMLCSVGLNFYLSWIARGFYMRYEELADEIRETFTSVM